MAYRQNGKYIYFIEEGESIYETLTAGCIYDMCYDTCRGGAYFEKIADSIKIPTKIYGIDNGFIDMVVHNYLTNDKKKISALMYGLQGSGKTVSAVLIAKKLNLPIIQLQNSHACDEYKKILTQIKEPFILFIDEFEKKFSKFDYDLLNLLDDVNASKTDFLTLLTSNSLQIGEYFFARPSPIRYIKEFKVLNPSIIEELVNDICNGAHVNAEQQTAILNVCLTLENPTVDCVKEFTLECLFNEMTTPVDIAKTFNLLFKNTLLSEDLTKDVE